MLYVAVSRKKKVAVDAISSLVKGVFHSVKLLNIFWHIGNKSEYS